MSKNKKDPSQLKQILTDLGAPLTKEQWGELKTTRDQRLSELFRAGGYAAREFIGFSVDVAAETALELQAEFFEEPAKGAKKTAAKGKSAAKASVTKAKAASKKRAAVEDDEDEGEEESSGGAADSSEIEAALAYIAEKLEKLDLLDELAEKVTSLEAELAETKSFVLETHFGFACIALGDEDIRASFEDPAICEEMLGTLQCDGDDSGN